MAKKKMAKKKAVKKGVKKMDKQAVIDAMEALLSQRCGRTRYRGFADDVYKARFDGEDFGEFFGLFNEIITDSMSAPSSNGKFDVIKAGGRRWIVLED